MHPRDAIMSRTDFILWVSRSFSNRWQMARRWHPKRWMHAPKPEVCVGSNPCYFAVLEQII